MATTEEQDTHSHVTMENGSLMVEPCHHGNYKWYNINFSMISAKFAYLSENARNVGYTPTLILFMTGIGLSKTESGIIMGFRYIGQLIGGPFWGIIADKWNCHRTIIVILSSMCLLTMCSQPFFSIRYGDPQVNKCPPPSLQQTYQPCNETCNLQNLQECNITEICKMQNETLLMSPQQDTTRELFGTLFFVIFIMQILVSFSESFLSFIDTATLRKSQLSTHRKVEYGPQRMWAAIGAMVGITLANLAIAHFPFEGVTCSSGLFIPFAGFTILTTIALLILYKDLDFKEVQNKLEESETIDTYKKNFWKILMKILSKKEMILFFILTFISGVTDTPFRFFYLHLKDLNSPEAVYSLMVVVAATTAFIGFFLSDKLIRFLGGTWKTMAFSFMCYGLRHLGYSVVRNPWMVLPCELLHAFSFCLFLSTGVIYVKETSSREVLTTLTSIFNAMKFSVGQMVGSVLCGMIYEKYGAVVLFRGFAIMEISVGIFVAILAFTVLNKEKTNSESIKNDNMLLKEFTE